MTARQRIMVHIAGLFRYPLEKGLGSLRKKQQDLKIPHSGYLVLMFNPHKLNILEFGGETLSEYKNIDRERNIRNMMVSWLDRKVAEGKQKFVAAEIIAEKWLRPVISDIWLKEDIVPYFIERSDSEDAVKVNKNYVKDLQKRFDPQDVVEIVMKENNEIDVSELVTLRDYQTISRPDEFALLQNLAESFRGKKMVFINATPRGGGVALMRHALIRLYRLLGVDAHWHIMAPKKEVFDITKTKFHNVLQAVAGKDVELNEDDMVLYNSWIAENAELLEDGYKDADVVVIDDPQPSGLIPYIKKINPKCKIMYRSHIQIVAALADKPETAQAKTWNFIWSGVKDHYDVFISHPIKEFIPKNVSIEKTVLMPATTDGLDGLNKPLSPQQTEYYHKIFDKTLIEQGQTPLDNRRPFIIQIARFDPSKGIPDVIESYRLLREKMKNHHQNHIPQLVICGHGSIDDPDGIPVLNMVLDMLKAEKYAPIAQDVKVARIHLADQVLNALLTESKVALQLSHKEGFEVKVSEALMKGVPVISYKAGGIPLQIVDGKSGFIVKEVGDVKEVAEKLYQLFTDHDLYFRMRANAIELVNPETTTVSNAVNFLYLSLELLSKGKVKGDGKNVKELIEASYAGRQDGKTSSKG